MRWKAFRLHRGDRMWVRTTSSVTSVKISEQSEEIFLTASHQGEAFGLSHPFKGMAGYEASRSLNGTKAGRFGEYPASGFCLSHSRYGIRERAEGLKESEAGIEVFGLPFFRKVGASGNGLNV